METCYRLFNPAGTIWSCGLKERLPPLILEAAYDQAEAGRCGSLIAPSPTEYGVELTFIQRLLDLLPKALCPFRAPPSPAFGERQTPPTHQEGCFSRPAAVDRVTRTTLRRADLEPLGQTGREATGCATRAGDAGGTKLRQAL